MARRSASPVCHVFPGAEPPAAGASANRLDIALVAMLGLLALRIFEATGTDIAWPVHRPRVLPHFAANYPIPHDPGDVLSMPRVMSRCQSASTELVHPRLIPTVAAADASRSSCGEVESVKALSGRSRPARAGFVGS